MGVTCDPGCASWAKSFGDCICSSTDLASFILGLASVVFMGICCLPQIIINFINGSSDGLSLGMILIWTLGDGCNIAGVFLTKALPTQVYMAFLFSILDILLNVQHCWYNYYILPKRKRRALDHQALAADAQQQPSAQAATLKDDGTTPVVDNQAAEQQLQRTDDAQKQIQLAQLGTDQAVYDGAIQAQPDGQRATNPQKSQDLLEGIPAAHHLRALSAGLMLLGCGMMTTGVPTMITAGITGTLPGASDYRSTSGAWTQEHLHIGRVLLADSGSTAASGRRVNIGQALGWVMTVTYLGARVPQLVKNVRRGTAQGLSTFMFLFLVFGSITYVLSIFVRSVQSDFVVPKLPWLIEALGAIILDGSILLQIFYYRRKNRNKPPPAEPAATHPLGTIAL